ncbi:MAG: hypothetical protein AABW83_03450 [Nanoarchaeota archaeon]
MRPIELIALIFISFSLLKIIIIVFNKKFWIDNVTKRILKNAHLFSFICLVLSLITLYYLLKELTISQIIASMTFAILLIGFGILTHVKELSISIDKIQKEKDIIKKSLIYIIIWLIILLWGLKEIIA